MTSTSSVYKYVMEDVIKNIKHEFLSEGIPESVLAELQQVRCDHRSLLCNYPAQSILAHREASRRSASTKGLPIQSLSFKCKFAIIA